MKTRKVGTLTPTRAGRPRSLGKGPGVDHIDGALSARQTVVVSEDLSLAIALAALAAEIALPRFDDRDFTITLKTDGSPLTDVDCRVKRALRVHIAQHRPGHAVIGEEYGRAGRPAGPAGLTGAGIWTRSTARAGLWPANLSG